MKLFITHDSALSYWQSAYCRLTDTNPRWQRLPSTSLTNESVATEMLSRRGVGIEPLHLAFGRADQLPHRKGIERHLMSGSVPAGSFEPIVGAAGTALADVLIASPELAFCQMAGKMSVPEAVYTAYGMCAKFRNSDLIDDPEDRDPLTNARALRDFCLRYGDRPGAKAARRATQLVCEGEAASSMEIAVAMLLTMPRRLGGYGLPHGVLNGDAVVKLRGAQRGTISGGRAGSAPIAMRLHGDIVWQTQRVVVEYDSNLHHSAPVDIARDAERRNLMEDSGWRVITITWDQVRSPVKMDALAEQLARALKYRSSGDPAGAGLKRTDLRQLVLPRGSR